ncbi:hypothetical protein KKG31_08345 [Patescibacteria group bacterium]|nr:hypothetical protein [Patescibacteria group bacterium]MBU1759066.1 hypothetical protein [Patescibacteria group bacterium]
MDPGQTITILADATVINEFTPGTQIVNVASITTPQAQLNTGDDSATAT